MDLTIIAHEVRRRRKQRGWTQADLAARAGCHKNTVINIEKASPSQLETLNSIAEALGTRLDRIVAPSRRNAG
jgi:transcriptional regulator with XRE-family HTH domain